MQIFELASSPNITNQEKKDLLNFVVVGGGPTSIEFCGELYDFINNDIKIWFPQIETSEIKINLLEASDHILNTFEENLSNYTDS